MRALVAKVAAEIGARELHCYGGLLVVGVAGSAGAWSWVAVGGALFYLALRRA